MNLNASTNDVGNRAMQGIISSKDAVSDMLEDGTATLKHYLKRGQFATEDLIEEAAHRIKRFPFGSVAIAFAVGAVMGIVMSHNGKRR